MGLGLAIVRHLVELHGGVVIAESEGEECGATFVVRLPLSCKGSPMQNFQQASPTTDQDTLGGIRVLVVDDEPDMRDLTTFALQQAGASVMTADSAASALACLGQFQPQVLLSDIGMPEMDGYALLRQIRSLPPEQGSTIPAIALTAYASEFDQTQAFEAGFQQHLSKPVEPAHLVKAIVSLIQ